MNTEIKNPRLIAYAEALNLLLKDFPLWKLDYMHDISALRAIYCEENGICRIINHNDFDNWLIEREFKQ